MLSVSYKYVWHSNMTKSLKKRIARKKTTNRVRRVTKEWKEKF